MATQSTAGGNIYQTTDDTRSHQAFSKEIAVNRDARDAEVKATAQKALDTANGYGVLINTARSDAREAIDTANAATADADNAVARVGNLETMAGFAAGDITDANVALHINQASSQARSAVDVAAAEVTATRGPAVVTDYGRATLQSVFNVAVAGDVVGIRNPWTITAPITVSKPLTIRCVHNGKITTTGDVHAFDVTASGVTFEKVTIAGNGSATAGTASAIRAVGSEPNPILGLTVRDCTIRSFNKYAIEGVSVRDFTITRNVIEDIAYAGVMLTSPKGGVITDNTVRNIVQPSGFVNSYGIAVTRNGSQSLEMSPRASDVVISGNLIDGVPKWEGIDTHGGENLTITNNILKNVWIGIAMVPGVNESGVDTYAPRNITITGNSIDSGRTDGTARANIQLIGCTTTVDNVVEYATGVITGNTCIRGGTQNTSAQAAIFVQTTRGAVVSANVIIEPSPNAINLSSNNQGALVMDNTVIDAWTTNSSICAIVYVPSVHQTATIQGNKAIRGAKAATKVNDRGLALSSALAWPDVNIQYQGNDFRACNLPIIDSPLNQNITEQRMEARRLSFYPGITPVTRQSVLPAATDAASTQALVNDLRAKLIALGLVS